MYLIARERIARCHRGARVPRRSAARVAGTGSDEAEWGGSFLRHRAPLKCRGCSRNRVLQLYREAMRPVNALIGGVRYDIARLGMGSFWYVVTILVPILWIAHVLAFALLFRRRA